MITRKDLYAVAALIAADTLVGADRDYVRCAWDMAEAMEIERARRLQAKQQDTRTMGDADMDESVQTLKLRLTRLEHLARAVCNSRDGEGRDITFVDTRALNILERALDNDK